MEWEDVFQSQILNRGYDYYQRGLIGVQTYEKLLKPKFVRQLLQKYVAVASRWRNKRVTGNIIAIS